MTCRVLGEADRESDVMPSPQWTRDVIRQLQTDIARLGRDVGQVLALIADRTPTLVNADGATIELVEGSDIVCKAASGIARPLLGLRLKLDACLSGFCIYAGEPLRCDDATTDPRVDRDSCRRIGLRSMVVMPLKLRLTTLGVLKVMSHQPKKFSPADIRLLALLSEIVVATMHGLPERNRSALLD